MDKELRDLFFLPHEESLEIYTEVFGEEKGRKIIDLISSIYVKRDKPDIDQVKLDKMIIEEQSNLNKVLQREYAT